MTTAHLATLTARPDAAPTQQCPIHAKGEPAELGIEHADMALYEAKRAGRDRAHEYVAITATQPQDETVASRSTTGDTTAHVMPDR